MSPWFPSPELRHSISIKQIKNLKKGRAREKQAERKKAEHGS
jgi:hypothetical protein